MYVSNNWTEMFEGGIGSKHSVAPLDNTVEATVVEIKGRERDPFNGEGYQGYDECYIIFQVGDRFFMKTGSESSYEEEFDWDGPVTEVFGEAKTVTIFKRKK